MTYRLKDRELQKNIDEISEGRFSRVLACQYEPNPVEAIDEHKSRISCQLPRGSLKLIIPNEDLESVATYNPRVWNNYPEVTPPVDVWMRCEMESIIDGIIRFGAVFRACADGFGEWRDSEGACVRVDRFRPWED